MYKGYLKTAAIALMAFLAVGCVYDFMPEGEDIQGLDESLLVIEGDIIVGGTTSVQLKTTRPLDSGAAEEGELYPGASVWVEGADGQVWNGEPVQDAFDRFLVDTRDLETSGQYRLCVSIPGRGEYHSSFKGVSISPQIDSVSYVLNDTKDVLQVQVSTHNSSSEPLYCKWSFTEDWESNAEFMPYLGLIRHSDRVELYDLTEEDQLVMTKCFSKGESKDIYIADTEKLSQNVINNARLNAISKPSSKLASLYAITVQQTALDKEAYQYWTSLKASINGTGGLFAPMPNEVRGNIVSVTRPDEVVLGYINASTATTATKFIYGWQVSFFSITCQETEYPKEQWKDVASALLRPVRYKETAEGDLNTNIAFWTSARCVDCRVYSNSTRPDFWPN